ncbi:MAG: RluA family pseudouridine synthase [Bacilli bacterium]|jgi:23S rRNA pseudouridine955/2504/2580 synthase|nr:RluA family pseudouridine synthase [Bacilli bacterium]
MEFTIDEMSANQRLDKVIKRTLDEAPLSFIYKMFRNKDVKVNGKKGTIDYITKAGDQISIYIKPALLEEFKKNKTLRPVNSHMDIIYEDNNLLIVNKPKGLLVHGDEDETRITLHNIFLNYLNAKGEWDPNNVTGFVPGPAHRLDRNTSGIVIFGKNEQTLQQLLTLFREKQEIAKTYLALLHGSVPKAGRIDFPLLKDPETGMVRVGHLDKGAKPALTEFEVVKRYGEYALVRAKLITGRTHQLRVHFQAIRCPIVGDAKYGDFQINKIFKERFGLSSQFLHAETFAFENVDGFLSYMSGKTFTAELPEKEQDIIKALQDGYI